MLLKTMAEVTFTEVVNQRLCRKKNAHSGKFSTIPFLKFTYTPKQKQFRLKYGPQNTSIQGLHSHSRKDNQILSQISKAVTQKLYYYI